MFDKKKLDKVIAEYKKDFVSIWPDNKFKWQIVKQFKDNWNLDAENIHGMLNASIADCSLLASVNCFPRRMLLEFAKQEPEEVRKMFVDLFDDETDICERIEKFKTESDNRNIYHKKSTFQDARAITTYLWLKYPEKYYIYKFNVARFASRFLDSSYSIKKGDLQNNINNYISLYNEINAYLIHDGELASLLKNQLDDTCYSDPELKLLTQDIMFYINRAYKESDKIGNQSNLYEYNAEYFLNEVYITEKKYSDIFRLLSHRKNLILQGPPGTGKTFLARRLAWSILGKRDDAHIKLVQFHQSYSYEEFIAGFKPTRDGFELKHGIFYDFCKLAEEDPEHKYFLIIDEINRGNIGKIFGELLMLIEKDYRGTPVTLPSTGEYFSVPENLYIIGTMNSADRSLALMDYALRRRFSFVTMEPGFESDGFKTYQQALNSPRFDQLIDCITMLNDIIVSDRSLGPGFCIGHSYFCGCTDCTADWLRSVIRYDILPMLEEYWFDAPDKLAEHQSTLLNLLENS